MDTMARSNSEHSLYPLRDSRRGSWPGMAYDMNLSDICILIFIRQVFSPAKVVFAGVGILLLVCILLNKTLWAIVTLPSQAAKDARASQDVLMDIFERIELFFRRLDIYTQVPPMPEMMDMVIRIMAEVLSILGIAMKEIKQGRMSKYSLIQVHHC